MPLATHEASSSCPVAALLLLCAHPPHRQRSRTGSFRGKSADFFWMLLCGGGLLTLLAPFAHLEFLGSSLTFMMVYVWGRRHPYVNLSFLGIFNFTAPYLPWVLLGFSVMLGSSPKVDLLGMVAGALRVRGVCVWGGGGGFLG
jgi:hypothetical protein